MALVTQWFPPEPVRIPLAIADALRDTGLDVNVLTGVPNWPTGRVHPEFTAWRYSRDEVGGHRIFRSPLFPSHDDSAIRRIANYVSWAATATICALRNLRECDVVLVYSSPATAALPALVLRRVFGTPYLLLIQDLWPDSVMSTGFLRSRRAGIARSLLSAFVKETYRSASGFVTISPGMADLLVERGVSRDRISLVYNWVNDDDIVHEPLSASACTTTFTIMYGGNLGPAQSLETAVQAIALVKNPNIELVFVGDGIGRHRLESLAACVAPGRVRFIDPLPRGQYLGLMRTADVQLVSLNPDPLFDVTMPSKVQSVLAAGLPIIAAAGRDVARIVDESGAGWSVPPGDAVALAAAFDIAAGSPRDHLGSCGASGQRYYEKHMSRTVGVAVLAARLRDAASNAACTRPFTRRGVQSWVPSRLICPRHTTHSVSTSTGPGG